MTFLLFKKGFCCLKDPRRRHILLFPGRNKPITTDLYWEFGWIFFTSYVYNVSTASNKFLKKDVTLPKLFYTKELTYTIIKLSTLT